MLAGVAGVTIHRFAGFELDASRRELRRAGEVRPLQPQAFAVLDYLVRNRQRAVPKRELLDELWPDSTVGEGSLQRAIHLVRTALDDDGTLIRTVPKLGYRFAGEVEQVTASGPAPFQPRFARSGDVHIAYCTLGEGDVDIVLVPGWAFPMRGFLDHPELRSAIDELTGLGRVILFDKRGTGLSDRVGDLPGLEQRMDDLRAVLDAVSSPGAVLVGYSEGGPLCLLFASTAPERIRGLLLVAAFARWAASGDYPHGWPGDAVERLRNYIRRSWGAGETIRATVESRASDPDIIAWAARAEQEGASPGAALALMEMNLQIDVRPLLPSIAVPTVVLHHTDDPVIGAANSRYLAARIPGARYHEVAGSDHVFFFEDRDRMRDAIEWLLARDHAGPAEQVLSTVLVIDDDADLPGSEVDELGARLRAVREGDRLWSFDGPQRALELADALATRLDSARIGVHTGGVRRGAAGLTGPAVEVATALAETASPGEILCSRVVRDLVSGAPHRFEDRGEIAPAGADRIATVALIRKP
jgi:pimeloyl-ACP methyl ester carboxylesterase